jgi:chitin synthase
VVVGEKKGEAHGDAEGKFDSTRLIIKKWEDWESERTGQKMDRKVQLKTPQSSIYDIKQPHYTPFFKS